jgi:hypothetical protein
MRVDRSRVPVVEDDIVGVESPSSDSVYCYSAFNNALESPDNDAT